ncbi:MAG: formylglycine-generating enzyme family protein [Planctomycetes bacterium]|nr:formylglycine-generating enzyme family protein [Planctomycetota bacterium]
MHTPPRGCYLFHKDSEPCRLSSRPAGQSGRRDRPRAQRLAWHRFLATARPASKKPDGPLAEIHDVAYHQGVYREQTTPVGSFPANTWGLFDMHGNIWEWCADWYGDYPSEDIKDHQSSKLGDARVLRGGSWGGRPHGCRAAIRLGCAPVRRYDLCGCRLVLCLD